MTTVIGIDWSGDATKAAEKIWCATIVDGEIREIRNGRDAMAVEEYLLQQAELDEELFVGLDFGFSLPAWYLSERDWTPQELWREALDESATWRQPAEPFYGLKTRYNRERGTPLRVTDERMNSSSVFQVRGIGSVGTGSIGGMPLLANLKAHGFSIWPFTGQRAPLAIEIYPRACLDEPVVKTRPHARRCYLATRVSERWLDLAVATDDAFDATIAALAMWNHIDDLRALPVLGEPYVSEGLIWSPRWRTRHRIDL